MKFKICYKYCNNCHTIDIPENESILDLISNHIHIDNRHGITHPNDEVDDEIRRYVDNQLKKSSFYAGTGHADKILVYKLIENDYAHFEKIHEVNGYFSDKDVQEIIKQIKNGQ